MKRRKRTEPGIKRSLKGENGFLNKNIPSLNKQKDLLGVL